MPLQDNDPRYVLPENDPLRQARWQICQRCPESFIGAILGPLFGENARRCKICRCVLWAKTRSKISHCPLGYW